VIILLKLPAIVAHGSGILTCNISGHFSGFVDYECNDGVLNTTGSCTCEENYILSCSTCEPQPYPINVEGVSTTSVLPTISSTSLTCDLTGYSGSVSYTCSGGIANVVGQFTEDPCKGGTVTTQTVSGVTYVMHTYTTSGSISCPMSKTADVLLVGGGGGGRGGHYVNSSNNALATAGTANTGGGGGGAGAGGSSAPGVGGSGIVVIRYPQ